MLNMNVLITDALSGLPSSLTPAVNQDTTKKLKISCNRFVERQLDETSEEPCVILILYCCPEVEATFKFLF